MKKTITLSVLIIAIIVAILIFLSLSKKEKAIKSSVTPKAEETSLVVEETSPITAEAEETSTVFEKTSTVSEETASTTENTYINLLTNADFQDGLKGWGYSNNVRLIDTNGTKCVYIKNENDIQARIWQGINVLSGKTYRLSFKLNSSNHGFSAIFQESKSGKQLFFNCNQNNENIEYIWDINPQTTERSKLYFYTSKKGIYCLSNIVFIEISK